MKYYILLSLVLFLAACGSPPVSTPAPTAQAIGITYQPALQPWADKLSGCASGNPQVALYFNPSNNPATSILSNEIRLGVGQPIAKENAGYLSQIGAEQIDVIVNKDNLLVQLTGDELRRIYSGQLSTWSDGSGQPIQVWVQPEGDPVRVIFDQAVLQNQPLTTHALLAPDSSAMLEAISRDVDAIGYLPASFLNPSGSIDPGNVHIVMLDKPVETALNQPVVALTLVEPEGLLRALLVCLQADTP